MPLPLRQALANGSRTCFANGRADHRCPGLRQRVGNGRADTARGAGYQGDFLREILGKHIGIPFKWEIGFQVAPSV